MIGFIFITVMYFYLYAYFWFATGIHPVSNESRDLQICANSNCSIQLFSSSVVEDLQLDKYFLKINDTASVYAIGPKHLWYGNENNHIFPRSLNFTAFLKFIQTAIEEDKNLYVVDFHSRQVIRSDTARRFFTLEENVAIFRETVQDKDRFEDFLQTTLSNSTAESKAILPNLAEVNADAFAIAKQRHQVNEKSNVQHVDGYSDADVEKDDVHVARSSSPGVEDDDHSHHYHHQQQQQQFNAVSNFSAISDKEELKAEIDNASKLNETVSNLSKIVENAKSEMDNIGQTVDSQLKSNSVEEDASVEKNLQKLSVDNLQLTSGDDAVNGNTDQMDKIKDELKVEKYFTDSDGKSSDEREELNISSSNDDHDSRSAAAANGDGKSSEEREELYISSSNDDDDLLSSTSAAAASGDGKSSEEKKELNVSLSDDDDDDSRSSTVAAGDGGEENFNYTSVVDDANDENVEAKVEEIFPEEFAKEDSWIWQTCDKEEERCDEANRWRAAGVPEMPAASNNLGSLLIRGVKFYFDQLRRALSSIKRLLFIVDDQNAAVSEMATTISCNDLCLLILTTVSLAVFVLDRLLWKRWQWKAYTSESDYVQLFSKYERMLEKLEKADDLQEERSQVLAELKCKDAALRGVEDELRRASRELENAREGNEFLEEDLNRLRALEAAIAEKDRQLQDAVRRCTELQEEADKLNRTHEAVQQQLNERIQQLSLDLENEKLGNEKLVAELQSLQEELAMTLELKQREGQLLAELEASKVEIHGLKEVVQRLWLCRRGTKPKRTDRNGELGVVDLEEEQATGSEGDQSADGMVEAGLNLAKLYAQLAQSNDELEKMRVEVEKEHHRRLAVEAELEQLRCERDSMKHAQQQAEMQTMEAVTRLKVLEEFFEARQKEMQKQLGMQMVISKQLEGFEDTANRLKDEKEHTEKMVKELREEVELLEKDKRKLQLQLERAQQDLWLTNRKHDRQVDALQLENKHLRDRLVKADRLDGSNVMSSSLETTNQSADAEVAAALVGIVPPELSLFGSLPELPPPDMPPLMPPLPDLPLPTEVHCAGVNGSPALYGCEIGRTRSGYRRSKSISREEINSGSPSPELPRRMLSSRGSVRSNRGYDYDEDDCSKLSPSSVRASMRASVRHRTKDTDYNKKASARSGEWRRKIRPPSSGDGLYSSDRSMETDASVVSPPKLAVSGVPPKGAVNSRPVNFLFDFFVSNFNRVRPRMIRKNQSLVASGRCCQRLLLLLHLQRGKPLSSLLSPSRRTTAPKPQPPKRQISAPDSPVMLFTGGSDPARHRPTRWMLTKLTLLSSILLWQLTRAHPSAFQCRFIFLADCLHNNDTPNSLQLCQEYCQNYDFDENCSETNLTCWKRLLQSSCNVSETSSSFNIVRHPPLNLEVNYLSDPFVNPYQLVVNWSSVQFAELFVVEYKDTDDVFSTFSSQQQLRGNNDQYIVTTNLSVIFKKPRLCPTYGFRVAAVNYLGMSNFSDVVEISPPIPQPADLSYWVTDKRAFDEPYVNVEGEESARTVVVTVEYKSPPNWHLSDIVAVKSSLFWVDCRIPTNKILLVDQVTPAQNDSKIFIFLPDFVMTHMCKFMFMLEKLESACQTVFQYPDKNTSDYPGLDFILDCDNVVNSGCKNPANVINPKCFVDGVSYELLNQDEKLSKSDINITWKLSLEQLQWPILYYAIRLDEVEPDSSQFTLIYSPKVLRAVALVRTCDGEIDGTPINCDNSTNNYLVKDIELGTRYTLQVCAVYESEQVAPIHWNLTTRTELDFTFAAVKSSNVVLKTEHVYVLVASVATLLFAMLAIMLLYRRRSMKKQKSLAELANHDRTCATSENAYVAQPRRFDHWELQRSKVEIDFDKRLGSGAFGAVYKGKINGRILGNRLSNSVLAENWTKMEDCDVAIKMLPEYADESAKSDFRKEINLMKQVGYHEKLVNMLGCITAEEPLCLIVEYCSQGDLLHYLRDRRKYMVQLESKGIDIANLEDNSDVDLDMVLCLKDLISFSWQASVGMEYLSQKGFLHRDVAARNILVDHDKRIKIGDFGLCRYIYSDMVYMGKGGRLPIKWMALEAIKNYEFTTKSDVWSFGVLLFEIITLGGSPYPGIQPADMEQLLESGKRMEQPSNCPDELYMTMVNCWQKEPSTRPSFTEIRERLRAMLEKITEDYGYMGLSENRDYYNVTNAEESGSNIS
ncbi:putative tyrosine-protein kinase F09A5.2 [Trichinella pseudospiralis]|uniref:receptor protein-tyrosine kinase n=1 Tax=Trichinella pseudospiralis TaxID=6337 RepID=A0A0V1FBU5_TRIPS|nr:putative tyrosine-protein kinase F09A5.2 [Trichinella pseudospiralis]